MLRNEDGDFWPNYGDEDNFFPAWCPFIYSDPEKSKHSEYNGVTCKKYYHPLRGFPITKEIYDNNYNVFR